MGLYSASVVQRGGDRRDTTGSQATGSHAKDKKSRDKVQVPRVTTFRVASTGRVFLYTHCSTNVEKERPTSYSANQILFRNIYLFTYLCMYVCMYGWMDGWMDVCVCMCVCMYVCMHICMYVCLYVCVYVCMYMYIWMDVCVCMCVCMNVCMYVYIYIWMDGFTLSIYLQICLSTHIQPPIKIKITIMNFNQSPSSLKGFKQNHRIGEK